MGTGQSFDMAFFVEPEDDEGESRASREELGAGSTWQGPQVRWSVVDPEKTSLGASAIYLLSAETRSVALRVTGVTSTWRSYSTLRGSLFLGSLFKNNPTTSGQ